MLSVQVKDSVLRLRLARPEKKNALDQPILDALAAALESAEDARVVLLDAEGDVFCAGGDVDVMRQTNHWKETSGRLRDGLNRVVRAMHRCPRPVVCAVQGNAYGAGALLAFQSDLTIVAEGCHFALSFRNVGLIPDSGATWLVPRIGLQRAKHLIWTGAPFSAEDAVAWGLALRCVPREEVAEQANRLAIALSHGPTEVTAMSKAAIHANLHLPIDAALDREARLQAAASLTAEHQEGKDAFFGRRRPAWHHKA